MGTKPLLRPGQARAMLKITTRDSKSVDWVREMATELEVPLGAVFDAMVKSGMNQKQFKRKIKQVWHDRYAI